MRQRSGTCLNRRQVERFTSAAMAWAMVMMVGAAATFADDAYEQILRELLAVRVSPQTLASLGGRGRFKPWVGNPVLTVGKIVPGQGQNRDSRQANTAWDAFGLGSMTVVKAGDLYHMYYEAWGRRDYHSLQIGHAMSPDGLHWAKDPANPVLRPGAAGQWDADGTWDPFVLYEDGRFKMWYGGGVGDHCDWGYAESVDGRTFVKKGRISHLGQEEDCHVVHDRKAGRYYLYYWDRRYESSGNALFRAESPNETDFDFDSAKKIIIAGERYPGFYKFAHVIQAGGRWHMFYANFSRPHCYNATTRYAVSDDGLAWKTVNRRVLAGMDGEVFKVAEGLYLMAYGPRGFFDADDGDIRLAILSGTLHDMARHEPAGADAAGPEITGR